MHTLHHLSFVRLRSLLLVPGQSTTLGGCPEDPIVLLLASRKIHSQYAPLRNQLTRRHTRAGLKRRSLLHTLPHRHSLRSLHRDLRLLKPTRMHDSSSLSLRHSLPRSSGICS